MSTTNLAKLQLALSPWSYYSAWDNNRPPPLGRGGNGQTLSEGVRVGRGIFKSGWGPKKTTLGHLDENCKRLSKNDPLGGLCFQEIVFFWKEINVNAGGTGLKTGGKISDSLVTDFCIVKNRKQVFTTVHKKTFEFVYCKFI
jgi:hypothetical protein